MHRKSPLADTATSSNKFATPGFANLPLWLRDQSYSPGPTAPNSWEHLRGKPCFQDFGDNPDLLEAFHDIVGLQTASKVPWTRIFPPEMLLADARSDKPLVVDMGGGSGHDLELVRQAVSAEWYPQLVFQDLPPVVNAVSLHAGVKKMPHDFLTPQPVKAARAYYMHYVMHDWPDDTAVEILKHVASAMEKGYSSVLIHDIVAGEKPSGVETMLDFWVWMSLGGLERKEKAWRDLIGKAGLEVVKIWRAEGSLEGIVEAKKMA